jgi:hypothetical protein
MSMYSDNAFGKLLKNWVAEHKLPENGRARLLSQASIAQQKKADRSIITKPQFGYYRYNGPNEWSQTLYTWFFSQSIHAGIYARA